VTLRIATRGSDLALWQANHVADLLRERAGVEVSVRTFKTRGDRELEPQLAEIGGQGLFTAEVNHALLSGEGDLAVHSLKDLPIESPEGLVVAAIPSRAPVEDALIAGSGGGLEDLPEGAVIGTSSPRREAFLRSVRPDFRVVNLRGNVGTRLDRVASGEIHGTMLARAGLERLGLADRITEILGPPRLLPAPGQGALGIVVRTDDPATRDAVRHLDDPDTRQAVETERTVLAGLGGGCSLPLGAFAERVRGAWRVTATFFADDGTRLDDVQTGPDPIALARAAAEALRARGAVK
jgi:hydroxymethylbilane synthase